MNFLKSKFIVFVILSLSFSASFSYAEVVNKIQVEGNERVSLETIAIFGDIELGKNYESKDINLLIKKLYETSFFSNISVNLENNLLVITLKENPIINSIVFNGEKAKKYKEAITEFSLLRENSSYVENYIKSDINKIREFYRTLGFYFIKIDGEIEELEKNRVNLIYNIDKGEKAKIAKINFLGDKKIREKRLRDVITSQESKFWKFLSRNVYLNKSLVELDKRLLKSYYKNKGYYEVDISSSNVEYSEGEGFILSYSINAGKRYRFNKIFANVDKGLDSSAFTSLENDFNKIVGDYYSSEKITSLLEKIDKLSEQKELQFINHNIVETLDGNNIEVKINIFEGKKFTIERINIAGNSVTNDSVIRSEMLVDEGDPYSELLVKKSINRLKGRGIFGEVKHNISEGSSPNLKVLELAVEEKATGEIMAGMGIGTDGTNLTFAVSENNWLGKGLSVNTVATISAESVTGSFSIRDPNYKYTGNAVTSSASLSSSDRTLNSGYKSTKSGFSLGTEFEQYERIYLSPNISWSFEDIEVDATASDSVKKMEGTFANLDLGYGIIVDNRNQSYKPTGGYRASFSQTLPLIMEQSSIKNGINIIKYHGFSEDVTGVVKVLGRSIHGVDNEDVRLTSRLFLPQNSLRGFNVKRTGPKDGTDWVGGNYATAVGFEARMPNLLPEGMRTDISMFFDTANVWGVDYSDTVDDGSDIRSSIGIAANIFTVVGPLALTLAQSVTNGKNDETEVFNFRLGTSF